MAQPSCKLADRILHSFPSTLVSRHLVSHPMHAQEEQQQSRRKQRYVFMGSPGAGKTTYATKLSQLLNLPHLATGHLVRHHLSTLDSQHLRTLSNYGHLLPDTIILQLLRNRVEEMEKCVGGETGFILDGFPRTLTQSHMLAAEFGPIHVAVSLTLSHHTLVRRCLGRRICSDCGRCFNIEYCSENESSSMKPPEECLAKMRVRDDDSSKDVIRQRLLVHEEESKEVEAFYRRDG